MSARPSARRLAPPPPRGGGGRGGGPQATQKRPHLRQPLPALPYFLHPCGRVLLTRGERTQSMAGCALFTGLLGNSGVKHDPGTVIMLPFPVSKPVFHIHGRVAGGRNMAFHYHVGVEFLGLNLNFREQAAAHTVVTSP